MPTTYPKKLNNERKARRFLREKCGVVFSPVGHGVFINSQFGRNKVEGYNPWQVVDFLQTHFGYTHMSDTGHFKQVKKRIKNAENARRILGKKNITLLTLTNEFGEKRKLYCAYDKKGNYKINYMDHDAQNAMNYIKFFCGYREYSSLDAMLDTLLKPKSLSELKPLLAEHMIHIKVDPVRKVVEYAYSPRTRWTRKVDELFAQVSALYTTERNYSVRHEQVMEMIRADSNSN